MLYSEGLYEMFQMMKQMSFTGSVAIAMILVIRLCMKKMPKIFSYMLWGIVLFRLLCPVSFLTPISVFQIFDAPVSVEENVIVTQQAYFYDEEGLSHEMMLHSPKPVEEEISHSYIPYETGKITIPWEQIIFPVGWFTGMIIYLIYGIISYIKLKRTLIGAVQERENIYLCDYIQSPFVLGEIPPKIYLPSDLEQQEKEYILLHEQIHVKRGDPIFRLLSFIALAVHWFNPLVWHAFNISGKDMEMSCDEAVMRKMGKDIRAEYSTSLLKIASGRHMIPTAFLAFGEDHVKSRIKNIMNYKKHTMVLTVAAAVIVILLAVILGSNPNRDNSAYAAASGEVSEVEWEYSDYVYDADIEDANLEKESDVEKQLHRWAQAFCNRDGETIASMSSSQTQDSMGWSSPWPWNSETDYKITEMEDGKAAILYYAWVSDPHVTVWTEYLEFEIGENPEAEDYFRITDSNIVFMQDISDAVLFHTAYGKGINNTPMDYLTNGAGEALNQNALDNRSNGIYDRLFSPETAVVDLLNLNEDAVDIEAGPVNEDGSVVLSIGFPESEGADSREVYPIKMIQPFGEDGIWIPQDYESIKDNEVN